MSIQSRYEQRHTTFVCNGIEVGGGSLRIHDTQLQEKMFEVLGFTPESAKAQFGFLMNAFKYGAHLMQVLLSVLIAL